MDKALSCDRLRGDQCKLSLCKKDSLVGLHAIIVIHSELRLGVALSRMACLAF